MSDLVKRFWKATGTEKQAGLANPKYVRIAEMYLAGGSFASIEEGLGCSWRTVKAALAAQGVPARPRSVRGMPCTNPANASVGGFWLHPGECPRCGASVVNDPGPVEGLCRLCCYDLARGWVHTSGELPEKRVAEIRAELARQGVAV